jgi:hypothetical protein
MSEEGDTMVVLTAPPRGDTKTRIKNWKRTYSNNPNEKLETEPKSPTSSQQHPLKIKTDIKEDIDIDKLSNNINELKVIAKGVLYSRNAAISELEKKTKSQKNRN